MIEEALIAYLLANVGIAALVEDRITPASRPQASQLPAITILRVDGAPLQADDGVAGVANPRIQIDCWGRSYADAKAAARAVVAAINAFSGDLQGQDAQHIELLVERDMPREGGTDAAQYLYRTSLDFLVWHTL